MNKIILIILIYCISITVGNVANIFQAQAGVARNLSIREIRALDYGTVLITSSKSGTVMLFADNHVVVSNDHLVAESGARAQSGIYRVTHPSGARIIVSMPRSIILSNNKNNIEITLQNELTNTTENTTDIVVFGMLTFYENTLLGLYTGNYNITVDY